MLLHNACDQGSLGVRLYCCSNILSYWEKFDGLFIFKYGKAMYLVMHEGPPKIDLYWKNPVGFVD